MKTIICILGSSLIISCGTSATEKKADSVQQNAISIETDQSADAMIAKMQKEADSIAKAAKEQQNDKK
jgi:hypothetical protein